MPVKCKGSDFAHRTTKTTAKRDERAQRTDEQIQENNEYMRVNVAQFREAQTEQNQKRRLEARQCGADTLRANDRQRQQVHRTFNFKHYIMKYT